MGCVGSVGCVGCDGYYQQFASNCPQSPSPHGLGSQPTRPTRLPVPEQFQPCFCLPSLFSGSSRTHDCSGERLRGEEAQDAYETMSLLEKLPESVRDSELETDLRDDYTVHTYREAPQRAAPPREEFWQRTTRIGQGGFGVVWLESCVRGQGVDGPKLRAVKEIKTHNSSALSYSRELDAFTKFSQRKVRRYTGQTIFRQRSDR